MAAPLLCFEGIYKIMTTQYMSHCTAVMFFFFPLWPQTLTIEVTIFIKQQKHTAFGRALYKSKWDAP